MENFKVLMELPAEEIFSLFSSLITSIASLAKKVRSKNEDSILMNNEIYDERSWVAEQEIMQQRLLHSFHFPFNDVNGGDVASVQCTFRIPHGINKDFSFWGYPHFGKIVRITTESSIFTPQNEARICLSDFCSC